MSVSILIAAPAEIQLAKDFLWGTFGSDFIELDTAELSSISPWIDRENKELQSVLSELVEIILDSKGRSKFAHL